MEPTSQPRIGGRYALVRRIARGGGGTVWEAHDEMLDRTVAVKQVEIPDELADVERDRLRRRVLAEARAAARLEHPAVVVVHDVIDGDDVVHLVMEYIEAPTLRQLVDRRGPLPEQAAAAIGFGLLDVLLEAHQRGVVHRDVKPSNVFVADDGTVKLADFGIAALTGESSLTRTGVALGSPSYLAPEQARGESAAPPADLWGLGASLYFAVEGTPPFDRRTALATVHAVVNEPMRPFERAQALREPLTALLAKDPSARPDPDRIRRRLAEVAGIPPAAVAAPVTGGREAPATGPTETVETADGEAPTETTGGRRWPAAALALGLVVLLAVAWLNRPGDDDGGADDTPLAQAPQDDETGSDGRAEGSDDADADAAPETEVPPDEAPGDGASPDEAPPDEGAADDGADQASGATDPASPTDDGAAADDDRYVVPESAPPGDWQTVEGAAYRVAVPDGWQRRDVEGNRTDWVEPDTGAYLRVDWTDQPADDPVADWEQAETGFAQRQSGYERIRLEPARYRDWEAAMWEYTYTGGGTTLHAINLNVLADDLGHAFALNLQAPAGEWERVAAHFPAIAGSFEPTVGG